MRYRSNLLPFRAVIAGCARNSARDLPFVLRNIERIAGVFKQSRVVICENDSVDGTLDILKQWSAKTNLKCYILSEPLRLRPRVLRIAWARNRILECIRLHALDSYDYLVMMDMDEVNKRISLRGFLTSFNYPFDWDVMCANQLDYYYDFFALRTDKYDINPWGPAERHRWADGTDLSLWFEPDVAGGKRIPVNSDPIPVLSCFGGLGIYRMSSIEGVTYKPERVLNEDGSQFTHPDTGIDEYDCEHASFHKQMRDRHGAKIYINPRMINNANRYHRFLDLIFRFFPLRITKNDRKQ